MERVPEGRPEVQRLAVRVQMEEGRLVGKEISPARAAQDIVMALWRKALVNRRRELQASGQTDDARIVTQQLYSLKQGWAHSVEFLIV